MKKFFAKIKENFDNMFFLFQLVVAVAVTVLTEYFDLRFVERESLILYLLILIAFDLYFVAVHRIDKIIEKTQQSEKSLDEYMQERDLSGTLESFIKMASQTIFISGSTMVSLRICEGLLKEKLQSGVDIEILLWDLCNDVEANALTEFDKSSCTGLSNQIKSAIALLWPIQNQFPNLKVRFLKTIILTDYVGIDVNHLDGLIKVQSRLYDETSDKFPNYIVKAKEAPKLFSKYQEQIEKIWKDAVRLDNAYLTKFTAKYGNIV